MKAQKFLFIPGDDEVTVDGEEGSNPPTPPPPPPSGRYKA